MPGPLHGLKVVDFSRVLAGPLCGRTLADLGADVIKIEPPRPDVSRFSFPFRDGMSGYYAQQNIGKRNLSIDLNVPGAREIVLKLCDEADILVENCRADTLRFFGLDYATLSKRNERLIYVSITGYGQGGPWRSRMAYAPTVQAEAGFTENSVRHYGSALTEPRTDSLSHADVYAGLQTVIAILAALNSRQKTNRGQYIDVAMAATLLAVNERAHVDLSDDPRFSSAAARRLNFGALHQIIQSWMLTFPDMATLEAQFDEAKIAMGEIRSIKELTKSDWSDYWGAVQLVPDRSGGEYKLPGRPWHFSSDELTPIGTPAFQGEHNREGFRELGVSEAELQRLSELGALVAHRRALEPEAAVKPPQAAGQAA